MGLPEGFFTGREFSTTPLETQQLAGNLGDIFSAAVQQPGGGRLGAQGIADTFGVDVGELGLEGSFQNLLSGGGQGLQAFDAANRPFQQRAITEGAGQTAQSFGTAGGRFSRNLQGAQGTQRAEQEAQFNRQRFDFANQARQTDIAALSGVLSGVQGLQAFNLSPFQLAAGFGTPGPVGFQEGVLGEVIAALGTGAATFLGRPPGPTSPFPNPFTGQTR